MVDDNQLCSRREVQLWAEFIENIQVVNLLLPVIMRSAGLGGAYTFSD